MVNFETLIDDINIKYHATLLSKLTCSEIPKTVYPSKKQNAFLYDEGYGYSIISYKWFDKYDDTSGIATFYYRGGIPYYIKISRDELEKYINQ